MHLHYGDIATANKLLHHRSAMIFQRDQLSSAVIENTSLTVSRPAKGGRTSHTFGLVSIPDDFIELLVDHLDSQIVDVETQLFGMGFMRD